MNSVNLKQILMVVVIFVISTSFAFSQQDTIKKYNKTKGIEISGNGIKIINDSTEETFEFDKNVKIKIEGLDDEIEELVDELNEDFNCNKNDDDENSYCEKNKRHHKSDGNWSGFEFGLNNYVTKDLKFNLPTESSFMELRPDKSWTFALNLPEVSIPLFCRYNGLVSGLGLEWNNYSFTKNMDLVKIDDVITAQYIDAEAMKYQKNTLNALYLTLPLNYEIQIPVNKDDTRIFLSVGVEGGVKLFSKTKKIIEFNGEERKIKNNDDYNLNPFKYGVTARLGYGDAQLFANYSLSTLFEANKGPELYPVSAGIRINF